MKSELETTFFQHGTVQGVRVSDNVVLQEVVICGF
jgi:hypothetical protein